MAGAEKNRLDVDELLPWLRLKHVPGIGNLLYKRLLDTFGTPHAVFNAPPGELAQVRGISSRLAGQIRRPGNTTGFRKEIQTVRARGFNLIPYSHPAYPPLLREIPDPPPLLYTYGRLETLGPPLAVVGARTASRYGLDLTRQLVTDLVAQGFSIVSGMARGIDTAAHQAALAAGGTTMAVLGNGLDCIYPPENQELFHQIARQGAVISEFSLNSAPEPRNFPIRNRVISGICWGTLVVEAARRSGSLITARLAAEQNREVFAVPGSVRSGLSQGAHTLIQQGAKLVTGVADIIEEFQHLASPPAQAPTNPSPLPEAGTGKTVGLETEFGPEERQVWEALGPYPIHIDDLVRQTALAPGNLAQILLQLELRGLIIQGAGKMFYKGDSN